MKSNPSSIQAQEMILACVEQAQEMAAKCSPSEAVDFVRDFVDLIQSKQGDDYKTDDPVERAYQAIMASAMFQEMFIKAYSYADKRVQTIDSLTRCYEA